ncbi:MAG: 4Fe-4S cluster-binding domain-containing protein, partial [Rhodospirillaceae bacterium]|nr:4Fe-4S cluster-binding domain-containing protein [Rhodospirillaceae bacterium]
VWLRLFGCNLNCDGFMQDNLDDPASWRLDYKDIDLSGITSMGELPVFQRGCDSSYSWAKRFRHLAPKESAETIAENLRDLLPGRSFRHPTSAQDAHLAFTGGEPLMQQTAIMTILGALHVGGDAPNRITVETNGTRPLSKTFTAYLATMLEDSATEWFWSVSPKIRTSGEPWDKTIAPEIVGAYAQTSPHGQLKYVVDGDERTWDEVERATALYRAAGVRFPVFIMPVGGRVEDQQRLAADIAEQTIQRGYNLAPRVHCYLFGNALGT